MLCQLYKVWRRSFFFFNSAHPQQFYFLLLGKRKWEQRQENSLWLYWKTKWKSQMWTFTFQFWLFFLLIVVFTIPVSFSRQYRQKYKCSSLQKFYCHNYYLWNISHELHSVAGSFLTSTTWQNKVLGVWNEELNENVPVQPTFWQIRTFVQ